MNIASQWHTIHFQRILFNLFLILGHGEEVNTLKSKILYNISLFRKKKSPRKTMKGPLKQDPF